MRDLLSYNNYIFDFDGVILDSNNLKGEAFFDIAKSFSSRHAQILLEFHQKNGGLNRLYKFTHFFKDILGRDDFEADLHLAMKQFQMLSRQKMMMANFIPGVQKFLSSLPSNSRKFIVSASTHEDLIELADSRDFKKIFEGIFGGPKPKDDIIKELNITGYTVYFGDSKVDYQTAKAFDFDFIFVSGATTWVDWEKELQDKNIRVIKDFT